MSTQTAKENGNEAAYPGNPHPDSGFSGADTYGLTKRELMAAMMAQGMIASAKQFYPSPSPSSKPCENWKDFALCAVQMADALLEELAK